MRSATLDEAVKLTAGCAAAAAQKYADDKTKKYAEDVAEDATRRRSPAEFVPWVYDTYGAVCKEGREEVELIARRLEVAKGMGYGQALQFVQQVMSVAVQKAQSRFQRESIDKQGANGTREETEMQMEEEGWNVRLQGQLRALAPEPSEEMFGPIRRGSR